MTGNPWQRPFVPAHRRKRDPLRAAQLAPSVTVQPVRCNRDGCADPWLIHRDGGPCLRAGCTCTQWTEAE